VTKNFSALTAVWLSVVVVQGYIRFRNDADRRAQKSAADRVRDARAREIELRNAVREGRLIAIDEAIAIVEQMAGLSEQGPPSFRRGWGARATSWLIDWGYFGSQRSAALDDRLGSFSTDAVGPACHLTSAPVRKRPKRCIAAK